MKKFAMIFILALFGAALAQADDGLATPSLMRMRSGETVVKLHADGQRPVYAIPVTIKRVADGTLEVQPVDNAPKQMLPAETVPNAQPLQQAPQPQNDPLRWIMTLGFSQATVYGHGGYMNGGDTTQAQVPSVSIGFLIANNPFFGRYGLSEQEGHAAPCGSTDMSGHVDTRVEDMCGVLVELSTSPMGEKIDVGAAYAIPAFSVLAKNPHFGWSIFDWFHVAAYGTVLETWGDGYAPGNAYAGGGVKLGAWGMNFYVEALKKVIGDQESASRLFDMGVGFGL